MCLGVCHDHDHLSLQAAKRLVEVNQYVLSKGLAYSDSPIGWLNGHQVGLGQDVGVGQVKDIGQV